MEAVKNINSAVEEKESKADTDKREQGKNKKPEDEQMGQDCRIYNGKRRTGKEGDRVELKEDCASTMSGQMYYYTIKDAIAMSSNLKRPLKKLSGTVIKVEPQISIYMVSVEIDEE